MIRRSLKAVSTCLFLEPGWPSSVILLEAPSPWNRASEAKTAPDEEVLLFAFAITGVK